MKVCKKKKSKAAAGGRPVVVYEDRVTREGWRVKMCRLFVCGWVKKGRRREEGQAKKKVQGGWSTNKWLA